MAELVEERFERALAVYAHPDDPDVSCGGTLARWAGSGTEVHVVIATTGDKGSSDPTRVPDQLVAQRAEETAAAGTVLGLAGQHLLGYPDGALEDGPALREELVELIRRLRPDVVVCPDPQAVLFGQEYFNHRDHRITGWVTLDAVSPAAAMPLYFPAAGPAHQAGTVYLSGTMEPDIWVDISSTIEVKAEAVLCHQSQLAETTEWLRSAIRQRAAEAGLQAGVSYAEGFRRLRLRP